jgi:hypothetical protein
MTSYSCLSRAADILADKCQVFVGSIASNELFAYPDFWHTTQHNAILLAFRCLPIGCQVQGPHRPLCPTPKDRADGD